MLAGLFGVVLQVLLASLLGLLGLVFTGLAAALRLLPFALPAAVRAIRRTMLLSFRFYDAVLAAVAPSLRERLGIDVLALPWRLTVTVGLSLCIGLAIVMVIGLPASRPIFLFLFVHGVLAGLQGGGPRGSSGFQMGMRSE